MTYNKTFIIAKAGVNHNGSLELAKKMIDVAVEAGNVLKNANKNAERKAVCNISLAELIRRVCKKFDIKIGELMLDIRRSPYTHARSIISYFSINELDYNGAYVAKALNVSRASVSKARSRGEKLIDKDQYLWGFA